MTHNRLYIDPREVGTKFTIGLDESATVDEAVRDIGLELLRRIRLNIAGTIEDIDPEFLHDLRVSVRRTRSLLSLLRKRLPGKASAHFRSEFKWVGTVTGPVRDLDVYLSRKKEFAAILPGELRDGLDQFFRVLTTTRSRELTKLRRHLRSERFSGLLADWEKFLVDLPNRQDRQGREKCRAMIGTIIRKRLAGIVKKGGVITPATADENIHNLRIAGKKFRYLLEFFRSFYDRGLVEEYLKQMKQLQNMLGEFNDLSVQRTMLMGRLRELDPTIGGATITAAALGGLVVHMHEEQQRVRGRFDESFAAFASPENLGLMTRILAGTDSQDQETPST